MVKQTKNEIKKLREYLDKAAPFVRLWGWKFEVEMGKEEEDFSLFVDAMSRNYKTATIIIGPSFFTQSDEDKRETIAHELIHIHDAIMERYIKSTLESKMGDSEWESWYKGFGDIIEDRVEDLARIIAPCLPEY